MIRGALLARHDHGMLKCEVPTGARVTYVITDACIDVRDRSCVEVCPVDCIHLDESLDRMCYIDPDVCTDCTLCEAACPVGAIFADVDVPAESMEFTELNARWFQDANAVRARVGELKE